MKKFVFSVLICICTLQHSYGQFSHEKSLELSNNFESKEVNFFNAIDYINLSGTLITPKKIFNKVVIIVAGSGKDTRKAHYKLTENLLEQNIAVYRFDDRGVGKSQGIFSSTLEGFSSDIYFAILKLKTLDKLANKKIGVIGHSLGGMATLEALNLFSTKKTIDFLVLMASPTKSFSDVIKYQLSTIYKDKNVGKSLAENVKLVDTLAYITRINNNKTIYQIKNEGIKALKTKNYKQNSVNFWSNTHINLYKFDLEDTLKNLQIPILYVIGSKDKFISPKTEIAYVKNYKNPFITPIVMTGLNHYLTLGKLSTNVYDINRVASQKITSWLHKI